MIPANYRAAMDTYRGVSVESIVDSAAPHQLVCMLFDGASAAVAAAKGHIQRREIAAKGAAISKAISIIDEGLKASLDLKVGGEMARNLFELYAYMSKRLLAANINNDSAALDEVAQLLLQLGSAWGSVAEKQTATKAGAAALAGPKNATAHATTQSHVSVTDTAGAHSKPISATNSGEVSVSPATNQTQISIPTAPGTSSQQSRVAAAYGVR